MRLISVNVAQPTLVDWKGELVETGIFKRPVPGPVRVRRTNLVGDRQADLTVHGGVDKAVYAYATEHYPWWKEQLGRDDLTWGMFGENLTTEGLDETTVRIGDVFAIGSAQLEVSQPRLPCFKLGVKFGRADMVKRFLKSGRLGFYFRVCGEGTVTAGDAIARVRAGDPEAPTIAELAALEANGRKDRALMARAVGTAALTANWREEYTKRLERRP